MEGVAAHATSNRTKRKMHICEVRSACLWNPTFSASGLSDGIRSAKPIAEGRLGMDLSPCSTASALASTVVRKVGSQRAHHHFKAPDGVHSFACLEAPAASLLRRLKGISLT
eukprot:311128-Pyramimonas_sp.AAC.1